MHRYEFKLSTTPRDKRISAWIEWQQSEGRNPAELIKNMIDEIITGRSCLTNKPLTYQGDVKPIAPDDPDDPVVQMFLRVED